MGRRDGQGREPAKILSLSGRGGMPPKLRSDDDKTLTFRQLVARATTDWQAGVHNGLVVGDACMTKTTFGISELIYRPYKSFEYMGGTVAWQAYAISLNVTVADMLQSANMPAFRETIEVWLLTVGETLQMSRSVGLPYEVMTAVAIVLSHPVRDLCVQRILNRSGVFHHTEQVANLLRTERLRGSGKTDPSNSHLFMQRGLEVQAMTEMGYAVGAMKEHVALAMKLLGVPVHQDNDDTNDTHPYDVEGVAPSAAPDPCDGTVGRDESPFLPDPGRDEFAVDQSKKTEQAASSLVSGGSIGLILLILLVAVVVAFANKKK